MYKNAKRLIEDYMYTELTSFEFKEICYPVEKFYRFMNDDLIHNGFQYQLGLNKDTKKFNPNGNSLEGGLSFCEQEMWYLYWKNYGKKIAVVDIPDDALIWVEKDSYKANKLIITKIFDFENIEDDVWIDILKKDYHALRYIKEQTKSICKRAIKQNGLALQFIHNQTQKQCLAAVQQNGLALQYVSHYNYTYLNHKIDTIAVKQNALAVQYVYEQNDDICKLAIKIDPLAIQYIKNKTPELCELAVKLNGLALCYIKNQTEELCALAVAQNGLALEYVKKQTYDICVLAVKQDSDALQYVRDISIVMTLYDIGKAEDDKVIHSVKTRASGFVNLLKHNY